MMGLRDLMVVYPLSELMFPTQIREDYERQIKFVEEFPLGGWGLLLGSCRRAMSGVRWGLILGRCRSFGRFMGGGVSGQRLLRGKGGLLGGGLGLVRRRMMALGMEFLDDALEGMVLNDDG
jgi:hypothetical protein